MIRTHAVKLPQLGAQENHRENCPHKLSWPTCMRNQAADSRVLSAVGRQLVPFNQNGREFYSLEPALFQSMMLTRFQ
jgi:hypothetical protein